MIFFSLSLYAEESAERAVPAQDLLVKSEVETAISMLGAIYAKHKEGEMSLVEAKKLGADLLRELRYGTDGYFWADTTEGVNVVLYGRKEVEGRSRLEERDKKGTFYIREILAKAGAGGGYVEYWFPKRGEAIARPKRSYLLPFEPFGWVVGSGYYPDAGSDRDDPAIELKRFVEEGARLISQKGERAFDAFRQRGGRWFRGDRYLFVWDLNGTRYLYPPNKKGEGQNVRDLKDADGKPIGELFIEIASSKKGKGWAHYRWPRPGGKTPDWKSTYLTRVETPSGHTFIIGSGAYDMPVQKSFIIETVDSAVKRIEREGPNAFDSFRSDRSQYLYQIPISSSSRKKVSNSSMQPFRNWKGAMCSTTMTTEGITSSKSSSALRKRRERDG